MIDGVETEAYGLERVIRPNKREPNSEVGHVFPRPNVTSPAHTLAYMRLPLHSSFSSPAVPPRPQSLPDPTATAAARRPSMSSAPASLSPSAPPTPPPTTDMAQGTHSSPFPPSTSLISSSDLPYHFPRRWSRQQGLWAPRWVRAVRRRQPVRPSLQHKVLVMFVRLFRDSIHKNLI